MRRYTTLLHLSFCASLIFLSASCSALTSASASIAPISTERSTPTPVPTPTPTPQMTATATPVAAPPRPEYTMNVVMDYKAKSVSVDEAILYPNHTGQTLNDLVLAVEPNYWQNCFTLKSLAIDETPLANYALDSHKLSLQLPQPLAPS